MLIHGNLTASILLTTYFITYLAVLPLLIGLLSRTARQTVLLSVLCGFLGAILIVGFVLFLRGARGLPSQRAAVSLFLASAVATSIVGWLTYRIAGFFREKAPAAAAMGALRFLFMLAVRIALIYVVLDAIWIVGTVDLADEIPQLMFLRLEPVHALYVGAAIIITFAWVFRYSRRGQNFGLVFAQLIPAAVVILLLLPMLMAHLQTIWSTPLLDCSPKGIPGYFPDMVDYTRFVLDALGAGVLVNLKSTFGWQSASCAPVTIFASYLVLALNLTPILLLALLVYRLFRLRSRHRTANQTP